MLIFVKNLKTLNISEKVKDMYRTLEDPGFVDYQKGAVNRITREGSHNIEKLGDLLPGITLIKLKYKVPNTNSQTI